MKKSEIIKNLQILKTGVTELGMQHIKDKIPFPVEDMIKELEPFAMIEKAFEKAIKRIEISIIIDEIKHINSK